jgi:hypothetical protein
MYLAKVTALLDEHLKTKHPTFFGTKANHPVADLKPFKDIHDPIWGTNRFSWRELAVIDSPIIQRLRRIHQTGLAYYVYPSARHSRFEHTLGVVTVASRVLDAVAQRYSGRLEEIADTLKRSSEKVDDTISRWRQELRLAALLHDTGHSLLSHASERIYGELELGFDADKLDYLLRDAISAGLPLRYDLERYLSTVYLPKPKLYDDGTGKLERLYRRAEPVPQKHPPGPNEKYSYFTSCRLRLPRRSMNTIEQITICKLMLTSYIYQHQKGAAEGLFERLLLRVLRNWQSPGEAGGGFSNEKIVPLFLELDDTSLHGDMFLGSGNAEISEISYRLLNGLLPRVVYEISPTAEEPHDAHLADFLWTLEDDGARPKVLGELDMLVGTELISRRSELRQGSGDPDPKAACRHAGVWFDVPWVPTFEGMDELIGESATGYPVPISEIFPINKWLEAYQKHRLSLRVFSFSEYWLDVAEAAEEALKKVTRITDHEFYRRCRRDREAN